MAHSLPPTSANPVIMLGELTQALLGQGNVAPSFSTPQDQWNWCLRQVNDLRTAVFEQRNTIELQGGAINEQRLVELREALKLDEYGDHGRWAWPEVVGMVKELEEGATAVRREVIAGLSRRALLTMLNGIKGYEADRDTDAPSMATQSVTKSAGPPPYGKTEIVQRLYDISRELMFDADRVDNPRSYNMRALARGIDGLAADVDGGADFHWMLDRLTYHALDDRPEPSEESTTLRVRYRRPYQLDYTDSDIHGTVDLIAREILERRSHGIEVVFDRTQSDTAAAVDDRIGQLVSDDPSCQPVSAFTEREIDDAHAGTLATLEIVNGGTLPSDLPAETSSPDPREVMLDEVRKHRSFRRITSMLPGDTIELTSSKTAERLGGGWKITSTTTTSGWFRNRTETNVVLIDDIDTGMLGLTDPFWS